MTIVDRSSCLEVLDKNICSESLGKFSQKHLWWSPVIINCKVFNCTKIGFHRGCFLWNFPKYVEQSFCYYRTAAPLMNLYLHRYQHIFPINFHLHYRKSYGCSEVYIIIGICHIDLLLLLCFTCRLEIMQNNNTD